jgi:hypothetical protein
VLLDEQRKTRSLVLVLTFLFHTPVEVVAYRTTDDEQRYDDGNSNRGSHRMNETEHVYAGYTRPRLFRGGFRVFVL